MLSILATFDAKEVTIIRFCLPLIIFNKFFLTSDSDPARPGLNTLVESQIIAKTP